MPAPSDEPVLDLLFDRLAATGAPDDTANLVLAACAGEEQLRAVIEGNQLDLTSRAAAEASHSGQFYLESVTVAGFRGVGQLASLRLQPANGLTLIVGRNGSGKSSFAEAAELCLTGDSPRWSEPNSVFRQGWRNLHQGTPCQIQVTMSADDQASPVRVTRTWRDEDTAPEQATFTATTEGQRYHDLADLGWAPALDIYRPFLTAGDFGRLISSRPSTLFDALAPILGLEQLASADKLLMNARKEVNERLKTVKSERDAVRSLLAGVDDDRARTASAILAKRQPSLDELDSLLAATDEASSNPVATACRRLAQASMPDSAAAMRAADSLDAAGAGVMAVAATASRAAQQVSEVLEAALAFHAEQGDGPCPVCQAGQLDNAWRMRASGSLADIRAQAVQADAASRRRVTATSDAAALLTPHAGWPDPADLRAAAPALGSQAEDLARTLEEWPTRSAEFATDQIGRRLRLDYAPLYEAFVEVRDAAADWLQRRHDAWREPAAALQTWLARAREVVGDDFLLTRIGNARDWLKAATEEIRASRLAPFAQRSQQIWEQLRQESNVELSGMRLDGSSTRRRVMFPATVDGTATQAMAVMSHGELQALGLAVFLPRASADDSPFRFLLMDDPVHSMDPSKVDGLAQVLDSLAASRQVIVFTHDNRLPEAVRRLGIDATIWEVTRREGSVVELRKNLDPIARYIDDARSLALTTDIPEELRLPVIAGFCRSAIEAACHERIRKERLRRGERHADVDALIDSAQSLTEITALALLGDSHQGGQVLTALNNRFGRWAGDVFKACQQPLHSTAAITSKSLVSDSERLARGLR